MSSQLLPESIRGGWYFVPEGRLDEVGEGPAFVEGEVDLFAFGLDERFVRAEFDGGETGDRAEGEFSFDGRFLILRGPKTRTWRIDVAARWHWRLEGKKEDARLVRAPTGRTEARGLDEDALRQLEIVPGSVLADEPAGRVGEVALTTLYQPTDAGRVLIGSTCTESSAGWTGVVPLVSGLEDDDWVRIVRGALEPAPDGELAFLDTGQSVPLG